MLAIFTYRDLAFVRMDPGVVLRIGRLYGNSLETLGDILLARCMLRHESCVVGKQGFFRVAVFIPAVLEPAQEYPVGPRTPTASTDLIAHLPDHGGDVG